MAAELRVKQKQHLPIYNHTLATILVEYASAVSSTRYNFWNTWEGLGLKVMSYNSSIDHTLPELFELLGPCNSLGQDAYLVYVVKYGF